VIVASGGVFLCYEPTEYCLPDRNRDSKIRAGHLLHHKLQEPGERSNTAHAIMPIVHT